MNWGNKLLLVFVAFGGMISYMVYRCMQTPVDLVNKDYYRDELAYQQVIDGAKRTNALSGKIGLRQEEGHILVRMPAEMKQAAVNGTILFYCAADASRDRTIRLNINDSARQEISTRNFLPGHYTVKIEWESRGVKYFAEQPFVIL